MIAKHIPNIVGSLNRPQAQWRQQVGRVFARVPQEAAAV